MLPCLIFLGIWFLYPVGGLLRLGFVDPGGNWGIANFRRIADTPAFLAVLVAGIWLSDETRRANLTGGIDSIVDKVQHREAFMVKMMTIEGASPVVDKGLRAMLPVALPASSFDIDLDNLRERERTQNEHCNGR